MFKITQNQKCVASIKVQVLLSAKLQMSDFYKKQSY